MRLPRTSPSTPPPFRSSRLGSRFLAGLVLCGLPLAASAEARRYELDPVHTRVLFSVSHAGFSDALGTVSGSTGELWFDEADWRSARLSASVPMDRLDLGDARWNRATLDDNLLDADDHPVATFVSTHVEPVDDTRARVHGLLNLRGIEREVVLDTTLNAAKRHPMPPFRRTIGFSASTTISRKAFGIDAWPSMIGDEVELRIEAEATYRRGPANTIAPEDPRATDEPASQGDAPGQDADPLTQPEAVP